MINLLLFPLITATGAVTANLTEFVRGESERKLPNLQIDKLTFYTAVFAYVVVWFALLVSGIELTSQEGAIVGTEYVLLFLAGLLAYTLLNASRYIGNKGQLWIYRLSLPLMIVTSLFAIS